MTVKKPSIELTELPLSQICENPNNARVHSSRQREKLVAAMGETGFLGAVVVDDKGVLLAGHLRYSAARELGLKKIPAVRVTGLDEKQKRSFILFDNRIQEDAGWDAVKLKSELEFVLDGCIEINLTGFETAEIDLIIGETAVEAVEDTIPAPPPGYRAVTRPGDIWELGRHRLVCGNALLTETYAALMAAARAQMVFTDPPYNVKINGHVKKSEKAENREFVMASGEMSDVEFTDFLQQFLAATTSVVHPGCILFVCMDHSHLYELMTAARALQLEHKQLLVWTKDRAGMGTFYRSQHELVCALKYGIGKHINNFGLGAKGRYRTNVWSYPMVHQADQHALDDIYHPTVKPTALVMDAILDCSHRNGIILDPFGGSGTTLVAAEKTGRQARLIELDPVYCDMTIDRWQTLTGAQAVLTPTEETFSMIAKKRSEPGHG